MTVSLTAHLRTRIVCAVSVVIGLVGCSAASGEKKPSAHDALRSTASPLDSSTQAVRFSDPVDLMREYARRDAAGERLGAERWFPAVATWEDEPGWDEFTVIRDYQVAPERLERDSALVRVVYNRLGRMTQSGGQGMRFVRDTAHEAVVFHLVRVNDIWKIERPQINQHVSAQSVLTQIRLPDSSRRLIAGLVGSK